MPLIRSKKTTHIKITDKKFKLKTNFQTEILAEECVNQKCWVLPIIHSQKNWKYFYFQILLSLSCTTVQICSFLLYYTCDLQFHFKVQWLISLLEKTVTSIDWSTGYWLARRWRGRLVRSIALHRQHPSILYRFQNVHSDWSCDCMSNRMFMKELKRWLTVPRWA